MHGPGDPCRNGPRHDGHVPPQQASPPDPSSRPDPDHDPRERRTALTLVAAQMLLIAAVAVLPGGTPPWGWPTPGWLRVLGAAGGLAGLAVMALGGTALGRGLTAVPLPNRHAVLRTGGLYRWVRHPIYSGLLLAAGSLVVATGGGARLVAFVALATLLGVKARWEEERLARHFAGYRQYARRTPRFVPGMRPRV
jgi:protein-S-isoprenylcysteine O-methyltransferase Ste14